MVLWAVCVFHNLEKLCNGVLGHSQVPEEIQVTLFIKMISEALLTRVTFPVEKHNIVHFQITYTLTRQVMSCDNGYPK